VAVKTAYRTYFGKSATENVFFNFIIFFFFAEGPVRGRKAHVCTACVSMVKNSVP